MKKLFLFLILFGGGLATLLLVQSQLKKPRTEETPQVARQVPPAEFTEMPLPTKPGKDSQEIGVYLSGRLEFTQYASEAGVSGKRALVFHADDVKPLGDNLYDLQRVDIHVYDPATDTLRAHIASPASRLRITLVDGKPALGESDRAILNDVTVTLHEGAPVVPLELRVPRLEWEPRSGLFKSDDLVQLNGVGLRSEGTGLRVDTLASTLRLLSGGWIELDLEPSARPIDPQRVMHARLAATRGGPLLLARKEQDGQAYIDVVASDGAELALISENPLKIDASTIHLLGRSTSNEREQFELVSADAHGDVVAVGRDETFRAQNAEFTFGARGRVTTVVLDQQVELEARGDQLAAEHAVFEFNAQGKLAVATFTGNPVANVAAGRYLPEKERELRATNAVLSGAGPLRVDFGAETSIDLSGPCKLELPELALSIDAKGSLRGTVDEQAGSAKLHAREGAHALYEGSTLTSDAIDLEYARAADRSESARLVSPTTTRFESPLERGELLVLDAREGLEAVVKDRQVTIPIARAVTLHVDGERGFDAQADVVRDFDPKPQSFNAEGSVSYGDANGKGTAARVVAHGRDDVEFLGEPGRRAHYELVRMPESGGKLHAIADAVWIQARGDVLDARGEVETELSEADVVYRLESEELHVALAPPASFDAASGRPFQVRCVQNVRARFRSAQGASNLACDRLWVDGLLRSTGAPADVPALRTTDVRAEGNVSIDYRTTGGIAGRGDLFTLDARQHARLSAETGRRVHASGRINEESLPYALTADWIEFDKNRIEAWNVEGGIDETGSLPAQENGAAKQPTLLDMRTEHLIADEGQVLLAGSAHAQGRTPQGEDWAIDAGSIRVDGAWAKARKINQDTLRAIEAWDNFNARLGERVHALGERLFVANDLARIEGAPASLTFNDLVWEAGWIEYDMANLLLSTDRGELRSKSEDPASRWSMRYEKLQPFAQGDKTILVLRNAVCNQGPNELHADWALFWVDQDEWRKVGTRMINESVGEADLRVEVATPAPSAPPKGRFAKNLEAFRQGPLGKALSEIYVEGNVELLENRERKMRASAIYLDMVDGHGWVQDADVIVDIDMRGRPQRLRAKAQWMRVSTDFSLRAESALITSCDYDEPHYVIESGDLQLTPSAESGIGFNVAARKNSIRFENGLKIPLPPLVYATNEQGDPIVESLLGGNSARYGLAVRATINGELGGIGKTVGGAFGKLLNFPETDIRGRWKYDVGYLGSRGLLLGVGLELRAKDYFRLMTELDGIPDSHEDKGEIRVPEEDRSLLRTWLHARGRYTIGTDEWFDLALSLQSDPGVQSEFFEHDYYYYEQKDNYLHWRKANGPYYFDATAKVLLEDRTDIAELPSVGLYRGSTPIGSIASLPIMFSSRADLAYLRRADGDAEFYEPFADGLGDRDVLRADTDQRFEMPIALGVAGVHATPYTSVRATAWDTGIDESSSPTRVGLIAGVDVATTLWKRYGNGGIHSLSPIIGYRQDVVTSESGGDPVSFDATEVPLEGHVLEFGLRSRWFRPGKKQRFDLELRGAHADDLPDHDGGLQPASVLVEFLTSAGSVPIGITHDGRYAVGDGETLYSRSFFGFEPMNKLGLEFGYHRGLDDDRELLYEAASFETRYRATPKWELELQQTISLTSDKPLNNQFLLRRLGHDFVMETGVSYRAGEGASFGISVIPMLSFKRSGLGLIDRWLGLYH